MGFMLEQDDTFMEVLETSKEGLNAIVYPMGQEMVVTPE